MPRNYLVKKDVLQKTSIAKEYANFNIRISFGIVFQSINFPPNLVYCCFNSASKLL